MVERIFKRVVLPAPFGPMTAVIEEGGDSKDNPERAIIILSPISRAGELS